MPGPKAKTNEINVFANPKNELSERSWEHCDKNNVYLAG